MSYHQGYHITMGIFSKLVMLAAGRDARNSLPPPEVSNLKKLLLVVADQPLKTQFLALLPENEFEIKTVGDGAEGLNMLLLYKPDIVLLDLDLPVMDGKKMLHHMRALPEHKFTPVLAIADTGDIDTIQQVKTYDGAKAFLIKSTVTPRQIIDTLFNLL